MAAPPAPAMPPPPGPSSFASSYPPPATIAPGPALAEYGPRLGGWLIDWLILIVVNGLICAVTHSIHYSHVVINNNGFSSNTVHFSIGMPGALLSPLVVIVYGTVLCGSGRGQTIGMRATGIKAVKLTTGGPIGYGAALGRALFEELMIVLLFVPWVVDQLFPLWDPKNQTLHDKVSGTIVVRASA
jgi:uncharacterized RDD family membrane protein YckC